MKKSGYLLSGAVLALALLALGTVVFAWSGIYDVGADEEHSAPVHALLEMARERSIAVRTDDLQVPPDLSDPARIRQGSGNYAAMCTGCHLAPGMDGTELSRGLYPAPPNLTRLRVEPAEAFWVIKHGIQSSGMPAWGESMDDEYIWNMAAFLQVLPTLDAAGYEAMVASSGGHSHGGGETGGDAPGPAAAPDDHHGGAAAGGGDHPHPPGTPADHHEATEAAPPEMRVHRHADGTVEAHPVEPAPATDGSTPADAAHDDGRDHQH